MHEKKDRIPPQDYLDDDDRAYITQIFDECIITKLRHLQARIGTLNCDFAGEQYKKWNILFRSAGADFAITDFEYDEDSDGMDLDQ